MTQPKKSFTYIFYPIERGVLMCIDEDDKPVIGDQLGAGVTEWLGDLAMAAQLLAKVRKTSGQIITEDLYGVTFKVGWFSSRQAFLDTVAAELAAQEAGG